MEPRRSYSDLFPAFLREVFRPGKQVFQEVQAGIVHMLRNLRQQMLRIFVDLQPVRLDRFHQAVDNSTGLSAVDGVNDVPVGPPNGKGTNGALRCRIVKLELQFFKFIRDHPDTRLHGLTINFLPINQINLDEGIKFKNVRSITDRPFKGLLHHFLQPGLLGFLLGNQRRNNGIFIFQNTSFA